MTGNGVKVNAAYNAWGQCNYMNPVPFANDPFMQHAYNARWGYLGDETGLYYCQNRYYDPGTGRFLTRDPISFSGGMNLYGYCGGGPVGAADPSGLLLGGPVPLELGGFPAGVGLGGGAASGAGFSVGVIPGIGSAIVIGTVIGGGIGYGLDHATGGGWSHHFGTHLGFDMDVPGDTGAEPHIGVVGARNRDFNARAMGQESRASNLVKRPCDEPIPDGDELWNVCAEIASFVCDNIFAVGWTGFLNSGYNECIEYITADCIASQGAVGVEDYINNSEFLRRIGPLGHP